MIQRSDRPFLGIWRGDREFTEWRRGERVLWQKAVPEVPKEKLRSLTVTAASYADLALMDMVLWAIGQGYAGHVAATIAGEAHTLAGIGQLLTVRSEVVSNDGRTATLAIGEGSELHVGSLHAGDTVSVELVLESGSVWLPKELADEAHVADPLPSLQPDGRWVQLVATAYRNEGLIGNRVDNRTISVKLNDRVVGTAECSVWPIPLIPDSEFQYAWGFSVPESALNKVLAETDDRPMVLRAENTPTKYFKKEGTGIKWAWGEIKTVINLIVTNADENML